VPVDGLLIAVGISASHQVAWDRNACGTLGSVVSFELLGTSVI
jgi:hypothetical protein